MAEEALTEPLLPRSTPPAYSTVNIAAPTTGTAPAHRRATNVAAAATVKYPAFAVDRDATLENASASTTAALASSSSPTTPWEDRPANLPPVAVHREDAHAAALENASAPTTAALTSASLRRRVGKIAAPTPSTATPLSKAPPPLLRRRPRLAAAPTSWPLSALPEAGC
ncbi:uncharacterized protein [Miscanthus floridulus]|uniref:uncharacterized protein n=1 Tax=Miscanthus floridulus TaxID=154761 RepID=UPI003458A32C